MSDVKLQGDWVIIEGSTLKAETWDFNLDSASRRKKDSDPKIPRRALVHDRNDGLTINYNKDYPGGVSIKGITQVDELRGQTLSVDRIQSKDPNQELTIESKINASQGLVVNGNVANRTIRTITIDGDTILAKTVSKTSSGVQEFVLDLVKEVLQLRKDVAALKEKAGIR